MITPIIIPMSSGKSSPDNKCPKCGHEWNNVSKPMSFKSKIITTTIIVVCLYFLIGLFDNFNGGIMYNAIFIKTVDNYEVPEEWNILVNAKGRYIIKKGKYYLTRANEGKLTLEEYYDIYPPLKCTSEKRAKSTLKCYLDKQINNSFRNIE